MCTWVEFSFVKLLLNIVVIVYMLMSEFSREGNIIVEDGEYI